MKTKKIKLIDVAKATNKTHASVSFWLSGGSKPTITDVEIMDKQFGIPPNAWYDITSYVVNNSKRFGNLKILRKAHNGNA
ncbi:MAG: helix-turn-helix transcriptional regulator [Campylobacter concisus]|jgi:hypothetical protein|uniref:Helix-turn-helix XRE-family like protein n=1 Tax=Siphoviridae sp. ctSmR6 TaxID=2827873 RepID=A0A8S5TL90_9CAUD|nr:helix-turn-helix transcriptional regulator [Campylobacter concisus]DAF63819.1 MAG TPA: Helix-turn-helix XRE-family like protein [Siphoviridae sp. ctSmR6]DAK29863.1 MAG TPA: Helix-turn-helix XRE-family like protein [Caudoviricetes sp.]DAP62811.1 MAG TPA: Helix-turn-helix XRE-family like protein [Inoviridae sp.]MBS5828259.1 helix-turn-helix transcriptional regulator [Campylobacter concisus]DAM37156.1 MAG TPA: Helix-turn-helix XRE-family like protein [Caudoviricetes sp.]